MLKMSLSHFGHIMRRQDSLDKTIMLGKVEGSRKRRRTKYEMDRLTKRSHRLQFTRVEQGN